MFSLTAWGTVSTMLPWGFGSGGQEEQYGQVLISGRRSLQLSSAKFLTPQWTTVIDLESFHQGLGQDLCNIKEKNSTKWTGLFTQEFWDTAPTGLTADEALYISTFSPTMGKDCQKNWVISREFKCWRCLVMLWLLEIVTKGRTTANDLLGFVTQKKLSLILKLPPKSWTQFPSWEFHWL